jgi:hypothetical protein
MLPLSLYIDNKRNYKESFMLGNLKPATKMLLSFGLMAGF